MFRFRPHRFGLVLLVTYALILQSVLWAQALGHSAGQSAGHSAGVFCSNAGFRDAPPASHTPPASAVHDCCLAGCLAGGLALAADPVADVHIPIARGIAALGRIAPITTPMRSQHRARAPPTPA